MKKALFVFTLAVSSFIHLQAQETKSNIEPKSTFEITINGKKYLVNEEDELKLDTTISRPSISIKLSPLKKFDNNSISFQYPRHLTFEFEQDFGYKSWTFSGNSIVIMLFEIDAKTPMSSIVDEAVKKFGRKNCTVEEVKMKLGNKTWNGKKLNVTIAGQKLSQEYFEIDLNDFKSRCICLQDTIDDNANSAEYTQVKSILNSSITFK